MRVEIYSDVACPWCYIGKRRFERALAAFPGAGEVEVVYRAYQLDPGAPERAEPLLERLESRFGAQAAAMAENVTQQARGEGLHMDFGSALSANTLNAHRLMAFALERGGPAVQHAVAEGLFRAHFGRGEDVGDAEVLARLAGEAGLDAAEARAHLASGAGLAAVREEMEGARRLGITAVPTFVLDGRYAVQGAQPASAFLQALETVQREAAGPAGGQAADACDDGECAL